MHVSEGELKEFIIDSGLVGKTEVEAAARDASARGTSLADTLVSRGSLAEDALRRVQAYVLGIPFVDLTDHRPSLDVLSLIPEPVARRHNIIAYAKRDDALEVALLDIRDLPATDSIRKKTGLAIVPRLTDTESMKRALVQYQKLLKSEFGDLVSREAAKVAATGSRELSGDELKKAAESLPTVRVVDTLLRHATLQGASDIHLEPLAEHVLVRYRIDGALHDALTLPRSSADSIVARIKILANLKVEERRLPQDGRFSMETEAEKVSFRVSTLPTSFGEKIVMRCLRETGEGFTLETLGFSSAAIERIHRALRELRGIILVSGPRGSGRTTTLYTMLDILNRPHVSIATIEDPIEYQMKRVSQTQVHTDIGLSFANGLRALLRQDPDVIMVGEVRDAETAALAAAAAQTGRLVFACIEAETAPHAIARLIELGVSPRALASTLRVATSQRIVPTPSGARVGIHEVLSASPVIADLILGGADAATLYAQAASEGMVTLEEAQRAAGE